MRSVYNYNTGHLYLDYQGKVIYDLDIRKPIVQITDKSSIGKTMLTDIIRIGNYDGVVSFQIL